MWLRFRRKPYFLLFCVTFCSLCVYKAYHFSGSGNNEEEKEPLGREKRYKPKDIHVVIGFYQGNNLPWISNDNFTEGTFTFYLVKHNSSKNAF